MAAEVARRGGRAASFGRHQRALLAPEGDRAGYLEAVLGGKKRKELRRQRRRLDEVGRVAFTLAREQGEIERALSDFGMTPALYRRGGEGMHIGYTIVNSPLGRLLVGATDAGVSSVCIGETDGVLERTLRKEYPAAQIEQGGPNLTRYVEAIIEYLKGQRPHLDLPVDIQATAFRRRVWEALRAIPPGQTRTYKQIATAIGDPNASRAVGSLPCSRRT